MGIIGDVDHYEVLGLPSGDEGAKLSEKEITKAFKAKALVMHPDKRAGDPNAHCEFLQLKSSYETLKDAAARKAFDARLKVKRGRAPMKRRTPMKRTGKAAYGSQKEREQSASQLSEQERIDREFQAELAELRARYARKRR